MSNVIEPIADALTVLEAQRRSVRCIVISPKAWLKLLDEHRRTHWAAPHTVALNGTFMGYPAAMGDGGQLHSAIIFATEDDHVHVVKVK